MVVVAACTKPVFFEGHERERDIKRNNLQKKSLCMIENDDDDDNDVCSLYET